MEVTCNGQARQLPGDTDLAALIAELTSDPRGLAVAVDGEVVRRAAWPSTPLHDGAHVEIVGASQGG